jgi:CBS domain-containing protein
MRRKPTSVAPDTPLTRALQMMVDMTIKSFPVVADARVVGIISREDVIRALRRAVGRG